MADGDLISIGSGTSNQVEAERFRSTYHSTMRILWRSAVVSHNSFWRSMPSELPSRSWERRR
jgi:hypothetical protein